MLLCYSGVYILQFFRKKRFNIGNKKKIIKSEKKKKKRGQRNRTGIVQMVGIKGKRVKKIMILMNNIYPFYNKFLDKIFIQEKFRGK